MLQSVLAAEFISLGAGKDDLQSEWKKRAHSLSLSA
jgi:hypothetical protein